jgi:hypothetical protein
MFLKRSFCTESCEFLPIKDHKPFGYWRDKENHRKFFDDLANKWNIKNPNDWNKVTYKMLQDEGGTFIGRHYGSFPKGTLQLNHYVEICSRYLQRDCIE